MGWDLNYTFFLKGEPLLELTFFTFCGDGLHWKFPIPCFGCGGVWFFGSGCFFDCIGMGKAAFLFMGYVGWVG